MTSTLSKGWEATKARGGDIEARSEPGKGTTIIVSLPAVDLRRRGDLFFWQEVGQKMEDGPIRLFPSHNVLFAGTMNDSALSAPPESNAATA